MHREVVDEQKNEPELGFTCEEFSPLGPPSLSASLGAARAPEKLVAARPQLSLPYSQNHNGRLINGYTELFISIVVIFASLE